MPSSDSDTDEDCYGNNALKLQNLKNNYRAEKPSAPVEIISADSDSSLKVLPASTSNAANISADDSIINLLEEVPSVPDLLPLDVGLPKIVTEKPNSPKKRVTRSAARSSLGQTDPVLTTAAKPSRRGQKRKSVATPPALPIPPPAVEPPPQATAPQGRGRQGARGNQRGRAQSRGRGRRSIQRCYYDQLLLNSVIYSVGNTSEYPDELENIPLFNKKIEDAEVSVVEDADLSSSFSEGNEELSVKVYWQQSEYVKFNIRRFQKLSQIFEFFSKRESVSPDKLLFTLKGQILRPDDTPDSIDYNIALFIDGGIVNSSIASIAAAGSSNKENKTSARGIMLKFQRQNVKKPFETSIELDQKLSVAMIKCAEHFELPYLKLRFMLDGESLSATSTPAELGLDNGDCIDVNTTA